MGLFLKWVVRKAITSLANHELSAFTDGVYTTEDDTTTDPVSVLRLQIRYKVVRTGLENDHFENVLHLVNTAGELPGAPASDTQKAAVETAFQTFWGAIKSQAATQVSLEEFRWYHVTFDDPLSGPPTRVTTITPVAGTSSVEIQPQCSNTVTMRTPLRKHWGRIYLPSGRASTMGFLNTGDVDTFANSFRTFAAACDAADLNLVIYSKDKQAVFNITQIECDNVLDVVRRRRPHNSTYRKIITS